MISQDLKNEAIQTFRRRKTLTVEQLGSLLQCSVPAVRKYLKQWGTMTSYNNNGRYYVLPDVPKFDEHGLWEYKGIRFSRFGTLRETIIHLVNDAPQGLSSAELGRLLGLEPRSFMSHYKALPGLRRKKLDGRYVYLSDDEQTGTRQLENREASMAQASLQKIPDHDAVLVFADFIKYPKTALEIRVNRLQRQGVSVDTGKITALLKVHGLLEKKTAQPDS
jgi:hypothetical protein